MSNHQTAVGLRHKGDSDHHSTVGFVELVIALIWASAVTSNPANGGHPKTGQRKSTQDKSCYNLPGLILARLFRRAPARASLESLFSFVKKKQPSDLWECGNRALCDFQARWETWETAVWFSMFSTAQHFHRFIASPPWLSSFAARI